MHCRHIAYLVIATAALLAGSTASHAEKQAKVAILGLEVIDDGAGIDLKTAKLATDLTDALRRRATLGAGPFVLAPNSNKDLLEMKMLSSCNNEARGCMASIGHELGAERVMYGKVERRKDGFQITLKLLNVESKAMERSTTELIQLDDTTPARTTYWSQKLYNRLTGVPDQGNLEVAANVTSGKVFIDNELKGSLTNSTTRIDGIAAGSHTVRVEAEGFRPTTVDFTIEPGKTAKAVLELEVPGVDGVGSEDRAGGGGSITVEGRPGGTSRALFWTTAVLTAAGGVGVTISGLSVSGIEDEKVNAIKALPMGVTLNPADACVDARSRTGTDGDAVQSVVDICARGESRASLTNVLAGVTVATGLAAAYFYYKGYIQADSTSERRSAARRRTPRTPTVQIIPAVEPTYVGAGVKIEF